MEHGNGKQVWNIVITVFSLLLIALLTVFINQAVANDRKLQELELKQARVEIRQIETDKNFERVAKDIDEIKNDIKTILRRQK